MQNGIAIIKEYLSLPEQEAGLELWMDVLGVVTAKVPINEQKKEMIPFIQELINNKSPFETRLVGN